MASSRRSASPDRLTDTLVAAVRDALRPLPADAVLVLAYSGGLDSTVLLELLARVRAPGRLLAWHVHHGLQPAADAWPAHCEAQARAHGVGFGLTRLSGRPAAGESVEAWAREQRYRALWQAVAERGAAALLTAHHADDQVETVLMRLARGAGPAALSGIGAAERHAAGWLLRPLLGVERSALHDWARQAGLAWIEDPMNADATLLRGALRTHVLPAWRAAMPGLTHGVLRSAGLLREALGALAALGEADLRAALQAGGAASTGLPSSTEREIDLRALAALPPFRQAEALRAWWRLLGAPLPSQASLDDWLRQLAVSREASAAHADSHAQKTLGDWRFRRYGERLIAEPLATPDWLVQPAPTLQLRWQGEAELPLPGWGGRLLIAEAQGPAGVAAQWLHARVLIVSTPRASARLRPRPRGPSRTLKNLFQERRVPPWLRAGLPMVSDAAGGDVLYVGGLGMDCAPRGDGEASRVQLRWLPDDPDDPRTRCVDAGTPQ